MTDPPNPSDRILAAYRRLYPFLSEEQLVDLRQCNRLFLSLALRQIERLKREGKWPPLQENARRIRESDDRAV